MSVHVAASPPDILKLLAHDLRWAMVTALARSDYRVRELVELFGQPMNLVSYHLKQLRDHQIIAERRSSADGRDVYYSLDLDLLHTHYLALGAAIHPAIGGASNGTTQPAPAAEQLAAGTQARVLFLCTHNSARSKMAEGIFRHLAGPDSAVFSAGSEPASVHPEAIHTLANLGIDISQQRAKHLDDFAGQQFDYIITVCDRVRETCPRFPNDPEQVHWSFADPAAAEDPDERARAFALTAQQLVTRIRYLLALINRQP